MPQFALSAFGASMPADSDGPDIRVVDGEIRVLLPAEFAGTLVQIERVSDTEIRIRKAAVDAEGEFPLVENTLKPLSDRDRDLFLALLDNPPEPTPALRKAMELYKKQYG